MTLGLGVLREATVGCQYARLRRSATYAGTSMPAGEGRPVVLVPGFLCGDRVLALMHAWLRRGGWCTYGGGIGRNTGCAEAATGRLIEHVEMVAQEHGGPVALLGYSRGGQFTRVVARRRPDLVSGVVTLGTPSLDPRCVHPAAGVPAVAVTLLGAAGVPGLMGLSCFVGDCCVRFREDLDAPMRDGVRLVAVRSRRDGIVNHRRTPDRHAEHVEIDCTHVGYIVNHEAFGAVADALHAFTAVPTTTGAV